MPCKSQDGSLRYASVLAYMYESVYVSAHPASLSHPSSTRILCICYSQSHSDYNSMLLDLLRHFLARLSPIPKYCCKTGWTSETTTSSQLRSLC